MQCSGVHGVVLAAELHLTLLPYNNSYSPTLSSYTLSIIIFLTPQVNSLPPQINCENRWGGKEFTKGGKLLNHRTSLEYMIG